MGLSNELRRSAAPRHRRAKRVLAAAGHFAFVAFILPGLLLLVVGSPLFGLGTWRARVASRTGACLLIVGGPAILLINQVATLGGSLVLIYLAW